MDRRSRRLILARDRIGKKPLTTPPPASTPGSAFLFGSEIKALLAWPGLARTPNLNAIDQYLTLQYVPAPDTAFIASSAAAGALPGDRADARAAGASRIWCATGIAGAPHRGPATNPAELQRQLVDHLEEAVRLRLISDVPLGRFCRAASIRVPWWR